MSNFQPVHHEEQGGGGGGGGGLGGSLRIGGQNIPYWLIGVVLAGVAVAAYLIIKNRQQSGTQAQQATGTVQAGLTPMAAAGSQTGSYDLLPTPYPSAGTTVGATPAQTSGLGISGPATQVTGSSGSPAGAGTGPITTPSTGGYPVTNQIYWVSGSGSDLGSSVSSSNPSAQSLTTPIAT